MIPCAEIPQQGLPEHLLSSKQLTFDLARLAWDCPLRYQRVTVGQSSAAPYWYCQKCRLLLNQSVQAFVQQVSPQHQFSAKQPHHGLHS